MPEPAAPAVDAEVTQTDKPTVVEEAASLATDLSASFIWDGEHAYVVALENGHVRTYAVRSQSFKRWLIKVSKQHGGRCPTNPQQWSNLQLVIESAAEDTDQQTTPSIRVAGTWPTIYIDLGDEHWNCAEITADGWRVIPHPADGPYFYRPARMAPLPTPATSGSVEDLYAVLNAVSDEERMLLLAWLVQALWPRGPYPILTVHGPHGSTKTTRVSVAKALTDPTLSSEEIPAVTSPRKPPRDERSVIAAARNNRVVAFDNVSYLDQWMSDALCRLATGAELGDRGLYSDFDEAVFSASRPIMINGIPDVVGASDLADRCVHTEASKPPVRKSEIVFWREFEEAWPTLLGVVFDLLSAAIRHWDAAAGLVTQDVRMSGYARIGEAIGIELDWQPGAFTAAYAANLSDAATRISQDDVIYRPLIAVLVEHGGTWKGTMGDLKLALERALPEAQSLKHTKDWPATPKALGNKLTRLTPAFAIDGIEVSESKRSHGETTRVITAIDVDALPRPNVHPAVHNVHPLSALIEAAGETK